MASHSRDAAAFAALASLALAPAMLGACGRRGFAPLDDASGSDVTGTDALTEADADVSGSAVDASLIDTPPTTSVTFGERSGSTFMGVTRDTYVSLGNGATNNFGGADDLRIEQDEGTTTLIRFELTALPAGATVVEAILDIYVELPVAGSVVTVMPALEEWTEGNNDGTPGVASYNERLAGTAWTTPGARPPGSAGDALISFNPFAMGFFGLPIPAAVVQGWIDAPATNFGFVLTTNATSTVRIVSSEGDVTVRPRLNVDYY